MLLSKILSEIQDWELAVWATRPVIEKRCQLALYHPIAEAIASMLCDLHNKILLSLSFNIPFYFLACLHRTPAAFFVFYLSAFASLLIGFMLFHAIGAMRTVEILASLSPRPSLYVAYTSWQQSTSRRRDAKVSCCSSLKVMQRFTERLDEEFIKAV